MAAIMALSPDVPYSAAPLASPGLTNGTPRHLKRLSLAGSSMPGHSPRMAPAQRLGAPNSSPVMETAARSPAMSSSRSRPGHARKQSSISYRSSPAASPIASMGSFSPAASPLAGRSKSSNGVEMRCSTPVIEEEPVVEQDAPSPKPGDVMHSGATLVQQHGELLSFIAQKERRCLDLREKLKKEEAELKRLKAKWEQVVAREVASTRAQPLKSRNSLMPRRSPLPSPELPNSPGREESLTPTATSPDPMTSPRQLSPQPDISASAKRWMGGLMKSANAMLENLAAPIEHPLPPTPMQVLREEEEASPGSPSTSSMASKRRNSGSSLTTDESAFFDDSKTRSSSVSSMDELDGSSSDTLKHSPALEEDEKKTPTPAEEKGSWLDQAEAVDRKLREEQQAKKHARRRSTFETLGLAATSFGTGMSQRWGQVTGSETFRNSKKATLQFVDQFERTLADAIAVDLDEGSRSPQAANDKSPALQSPAQVLPSGVGLFGWRSPAGGLDALAEEEEGESQPAPAKSPRIRAKPRSRQHSRKQSSDQQGLQQWQTM